MPTAFTPEERVRTVLWNEGRMGAFWASWWTEQERASAPCERRGGGSGM